MYQNYIFDLYGTLVDIHTNENSAVLWKRLALFMSLQGAAYSGPELKKAYARVIREERSRCFHAASVLHPEHLPEETEVEFHPIITALYRSKGVEPDESMICQWALIFRSLSMQRLHLFEGADALLRDLHARGCKVYLLSNAQRLFTEPEMRMLGIYERFDDIFYSSDIGFTKPSPLFYQALLEKHRLDPKQSVMVGNDYLADAWGAHRSGMASVYIHTEQSPEIQGELPPDCTVIQNIREVLAIQ